VCLLFDYNVPAPLRRLLTRYEIKLAGELCWHDLANGELAAEQAGFELLLIADQNIHYQQNLTGRRIALVVLSTNSWPDLEPHVLRIQQAIDWIGQGGYVELDSLVGSFFAGHLRLSTGSLRRIAHVPVFL
jgi:hypothetical protein